MRKIGAIAAMLITIGKLVPCSMFSIQPDAWTKPPGKSSALFPFEQGGKVGFINASGNVVIAPALPGPVGIWGPFSDGLAKVGREGYVNEAGEWAIRGRYRWLGDFSDGVAQVLLETSDQALLVDRKGKIIARETALGEFREGLRPTWAEQSTVQKVSDRVWVLPLEGFQDRSGKVVVEPRFVKVRPFAEGLARAIPNCKTSRELRLYYPGASCDDHWPGGGSCGVGFLNRQGVFAIAPRFEDARDFSEGLAPVQQGGKWGFIDRSGKMVIPATFESASPFQEGLAAVSVEREEDSRGWGFIDKRGKLVIPAKFAFVSGFSDSMARVGLRDGSVAYIDRQGRVRFSGISGGDFAHGLIHVFRAPDQVAYLNHDGQEVFRFTQSRN